MTLRRLLQFSLTNLVETRTTFRSPWELLGGSSDSQKTLVLLRYSTPEFKTSWVITDLRYRERFWFSGSVKRGQSLAAQVNVCTARCVLLVRETVQISASVRCVWYSTHINKVSVTLIDSSEAYLFISVCVFFFCCCVWSEFLKPLCHHLWDHRRPVRPNINTTTCFYETRRSVNWSRTNKVPNKALVQIVRCVSVFWCYKNSQHVSHSNNRNTNGFSYEDVKLLTRCIIFRDDIICTDPSTCQGKKYLNSAMEWLNHVQHLLIPAQALSDVYGQCGEGMWKNPDVQTLTLQLLCVFITHSLCLSCNTTRHWTKSIRRKLQCEVHLL